MVSEERCGACREYRSFFRGVLVVGVERRGLGGREVFCFVVGFCVCWCVG